MKLQLGEKKHVIVQVTTYPELAFYLKTGWQTLKKKNNAALARLKSYSPLRYPWIVVGGAQVIFILNFNYTPSRVF